MSVRDKTEQAKTKVSDAYGSAKESAGRTYESAKDSAERTYESVKDSASRAYDNTRTKAVDAYDRTRQGVRDGARKTGEGIEESPLIALGIGAVLGLVAGALLPRSEREKRALSDVGGKLNSRAHQAYDAAKGAGAETLRERGITPEAGEGMLRDVVKGVGAAARRSADAASEAAKTK